MTAKCVRPVRITTSPIRPVTSYNSANRYSLSDSQGDGAVGRGSVDKKDKGAFYTLSETEGPWHRAAIWLEAVRRLSEPGPTNGFVCLLHKFLLRWK